MIFFFKSNQQAQQETSVNALLQYTETSPNMHCSNNKYGYIVLAFMLYIYIF